MDAPSPGHQTNGSAGGGWSNLPRDLAADINGRLNFVDRLAFTAVFGEAFKQEAPWLLLDGLRFQWDTAMVFSLVDRRAATVRVPDPALPDRVILGSSGGWVVTADKRARMHMLNPVTGEQAALPAIATMSFVGDADPWFTLDMIPFRDTLYGGTRPPNDYDLTPFNAIALKTAEKKTLPYFDADEIRFSFYSKVVLAATPRPGSYAAMLILDRKLGLGATAFATARNPAWRLASSRDGGIEDAIHHKGRFYSITFSGVVEVWEEQHDGEFTSKAVTSSSPSLAKEDDEWRCRKYLVAALDGRLMVLVKKEKKEEDSRTWTCSFTVQLLDDATGRWEEEADIGEAALFVGVNSSLCVSTREHPELIAGGVYFTYDQLAKAETRREKSLRRRYGYLESCTKRDVGVYRLKDCKVKSIKTLGQHPSWPPPAWFTPSFS